MGTVIPEEFCGRKGDKEREKSVNEKMDSMWVKGKQKPSADNDLVIVRIMYM